MSVDVRNAIEVLFKELDSKEQQLVFDDFNIKAEAHPEYCMRLCILSILKQEKFIGYTLADIIDAELYKAVGRRRYQDTIRDVITQLLSRSDIAIGDL